MKAFWREHKNKNAFLWGLAGLLAVWCLWYSRPVDIHFLLGTAQPDCASGLVIKDVGSPWKSRKERSFTVEGPDMEALLGELENLRFRRSPLEPLLKILPPLGGRSTTTKYEDTDYQIGLCFYSTENQEQWTPLLNLEFWIDRWTYGAYASLPLSVSAPQEKGRTLGAWLWDWAEQFDSKS